MVICVSYLMAAASYWVTEETGSLGTYDYNDHDMGESISNIRKLGIQAEFIFDCKYWSSVSNISIYIYIHSLLSLKNCLSD